MSGETQAGNFQELLKSLGEVVDQTETLAKAAAPAADDKAVAAAAADAGVNPEDGEDEEGDGEEGGDPMAKSDAADGDMVDATDLIKSLIGRLDSTDDVLAKALGSFTGVLTKQNDLIKSLQAEVKALGNQGRGRKTLLVATEKPPIGDLAKSGAASSEEGGITPGDLLAKSEAAFKAGKLSGNELNTVDVCLRNGWQIDASVLRKVASA